MVTKRMMSKHWKMVVVLLCICGGLLLLRWAAMFGVEEDIVSDTS